MRVGLINHRMKCNIFSMVFLLLLDRIYLIKMNGKKLSMEYGQK